MRAGWDNSDGIEGMQVEQSTVVKGRTRGRAPGQRPPPLGSTASTDGLLGGTPMHHVVVMQSSKGQMNMQVRAHAHRRVWVCAGVHILRVNCISSS